MNEPTTDTSPYWYRGTKHIWDDTKQDWSHPNGGTCADTTCPGNEFANAAQPGTVANLTERLRNAGRMVDHFRNELVTAREKLAASERLHDQRDAIERKKMFAPVPTEAADSTLPRYFVDLDGHAEPTIWQGTGPDDPNCQPIARKCTLDGEHPVLWPTVVQALTEQIDPNPEWLADGAEFGTGAGGAR